MRVLGVTYIMLLRNDALGAAAMLAGGTPGAEAQREALERLGATNVQQFAVSGSYDVVILADFADERSVLAFSLGATASGQYVEVLRAYSADDVEAARELATRALSDADEVPGSEGT